MKRILALFLIKLGTVILIGISVFGMYWGLRYVGLPPFWAFIIATAIFVIAEWDSGAPSRKALKHPFSRYWSRSN